MTELKIDQSLENEIEDLLTGFNLEVYKVVRTSDHIDFICKGKEVNVTIGLYNYVDYFKLKTSINGRQVYDDMLWFYSDLVCIIDAFLAEYLP